tara:strand:- start:1934 stop:2251 length:318 start_codon:yes stop_codon:yes gene_type:complete
LAPRPPNIPAVVLGGRVVVADTGAVVVGANVVAAAAAKVVVVAGATVVVVVVVVVVGGAGTASIGRPRAAFSARWASRVAGPYHPSASIPRTLWRSTASALGPQT